MSDKRAYYARAYSRDAQAVDVEAMRSFADTCGEWAARADDANARQTITTAAQNWRNVARTLNRTLAEGAALVDDLRRKLD